MIPRLLVRCFLGGLCVALVVTVPVKGQEARLDYSHLDRLADKAENVVDITLDESLLRLASRFLSSEKEEVAVKELIQGLKGIFVRSYTFDQPGIYTQEDLRIIREQTNKAGWKRLVGVRSKRQSSGNLEVFMMHDDRTVRGVAILAADPRQLTVVNILGPIDIAKLRDLEGQFGIPELGLEEGEAGKKGREKDE